MKQNQKSRRFSFQKLARTENYKKLLAEGCKFKTEAIDETRVKKELKNKLNEEALEVIEAEIRHELLEELGDVLEVIHALAKAHGSSFEEVEKLRQEKLKDRGEFSSSLFIEWVEFPAGHRLIDYCLRNSHKYPEIKNT